MRLKIYAPSCLALGSFFIEMVCYYIENKLKQISLREQKEATLQTQVRSNEIS